MWGNEQAWWRSGSVTGHHRTGLCSPPSGGCIKDTCADLLEQRTLGGQRQRGFDLVKFWLRQGSAGPLPFPICEWRVPTPQPLCWGQRAGLPVCVPHANRERRRWLLLRVLLIFTAQISKLRLIEADYSLQVIPDEAKILIKIFLHSLFIPQMGPRN